MGLRPTHVHVDFEVAEHNAIRLVFPDARLAACYFHLKQAWHRQWVKLYGKQKRDQWKEVNSYATRMAQALNYPAFCASLVTCVSGSISAGSPSFLSIFSGHG